MATTLSPTPHADRLLRTQLRWFVSLRWLAALTVLLCGFAQSAWLDWYQPSWSLPLIGLLILLYNIPLYFLTQKAQTINLSPATMVWTQMIPDLLALTALVLLTDGVRSPLLGFFAFHMVLGSLLLSPLQAYAVALIAVILLTFGLFLTDQLPHIGSPLRERTSLGGWGLALLLTVFLANQITRSLRSRHRQLLLRNLRIHALADRLQQQQQALIQHEKMIALGQLAAGVAHEIANPLANIDSLLQLIQRQPTHLTDQNLNALRQQVQRIEQTIRQMTSFAHPTQYTWESVPANDLIENALQMIRFDRRHKQVQITRHYRQPGCLLKIQPHAVQQALINVLLNAMDAVADVPNPTLIVSSQYLNDHCLISISDNGHGISPENLPRLFEPFFTTKPVGKGTGLGLAISYNLIQNQGGKIEIQSQPGQGTTVTFHLPKTTTSSP